MVLVVDNYDSFTYNLIQYIGENNQEIDLVKNDTIDFSKINNSKYNLADGYKSEFNLQNTAWIKSIAQITGKWNALLIDYGFKNSEFLHPDRNCGTLRCYKNHKADDNPLIDIGKKDITSWVNFSNIIDCAKSCGLRTISYQTQSHFLIELEIPFVFFGF